MTDTDQTRARILELARTVGLVDDANLDVVADLVARAAEVGNGLDEHAMVGLIQAYGRAVDRIAGAEAQVAARHLAQLPDAAFEPALHAWMAEVLPLATETFSVIHARRLEQLVRRRSIADAAAFAAGATSHDLEVADLAVAMVDLRGSTAFMLEHSSEEVCALVDDLYLAVGRVAEEHQVHAGKFLGDGVLFFSADSERLLAAARAAVVELGEQTALRAGAGIARGPVIRHAGDWFGTPVNLASRLGELAGPDEVLVDEGAVPPERAVTAWRWSRPRGLTEERRLAVF